MRALKHMKWRLTIVLLGLLGTPASCVAPDYYITLTANPDVVIADTHSFTTISATVQDSSGRTVQDGTVVAFSASLGTLDQTATTSSGVARARLESGSVVGTCVVTAAVLGSRGAAEKRVEFVPQGTRMQALGTLSVSAEGRLVYDTENRSVQGFGGVTSVHAGVNFIGQTVEIDLNRNTFTMRGALGGQDVRVEKGSHSLAASEVFYDITKRRGVIYTPSSEGAKRMEFLASDMGVTESRGSPRVAKTEEKSIQSRVVITAKKMIIKPGRDIKMVEPVFYVDGVKTMSMPLYRLWLRPGGGGTRDRFITYGSEGLRLDVPLYYQLDPSSTGAIRVRRMEGEAWGSYAGSRNWQVDLEQEYEPGDDVQGTVSLQRMGYGDWGARWSQRATTANGAQIYTYVDAPRHNDFYFNVDSSFSTKAYSLSANIRGARRSQGLGRHFTGLFFQSKPRELVRRALSFSVSSRAFYDSSPTAVGQHLGNGFGLQLNGGPLMLSRDTSMYSSLNASRVFGGGASGSTAYGNIGMYTRLGRIGRFGANYNQSWMNGANGVNSRNISTDVSVAGRAWRASVSLIKGIDRNTTSAFGELDYTFSPDWDFRTIGTLQSFSGSQYIDVETGIVRQLGNQEARLIYSRSRKRFLFEFSAAGM